LPRGSRRGAGGPVDRRPPSAREKKRPGTRSAGCRRRPASGAGGGLPAQDEAELGDGRSGRVWPRSPTPLPDFTGHPRREPETPGSGRAHAPTRALAGEVLHAGKLGNARRSPQAYPPAGSTSICRFPFRSYLSPNTFASVILHMAYGAACRSGFRSERQTQRKIHFRRAPRQPRRATISRATGCGHPLSVLQAGA